MKLISWNVNGIRAAQRKGFLEWFKKQKADIICVQELKARSDQVDDELRNPHKYFAHWNSAQKAGYSGTAIFSKKEPLSIVTGVGLPGKDDEGRVQIADFGKFVLVNAYFPNSQPYSHPRLPYKLKFCDAMLKTLNKYRKKGKNLILCGDFNIAHTELDLARPKTNNDTAGFLPEERAWFDELVAASYVDAFREFEEGNGHYTFWSQRFIGARAKNIGWRLDYHVVNPEFRDRLKASKIHSSVMGSDHCPILLEIKD